MGALSFSPSPITTTPSMATVSSIRRMASTAAWSAASLSPRPIQRPAASAAASVTRTSSSARLRSGAARVLVARSASLNWATRGSYSRRRLEGRRLDGLEEDDEQPCADDQRPAGQDGPAELLAKDRPGEERGRNGLEVAE